MSLVTPITVEQLRKALHAKAKEEVGFRFYLLYDKVYRRDVLSHVYALSRAARGAPGVDGETFARIEETGAGAVARRTGRMAAEDVVGRLNRLLLGWGNSFHLGPVSKAYRAIDPHTGHRLRRWLCVETQDRRPGDAPLPKRVPGLGPGTHAPVGDDAQPSVGEGMILERAGCGSAPG